jgi:hypothetical protein
MSGQVNVLAALLLLLLLLLLLAAVRWRALFEFSLCLSRACLGKMIVLMHKWLKNAVFRRTLPKGSVKGMALNLHNNIWNTNYPLYFPYYDPRYCTDEAEPMSCRCQSDFVHLQ